jgi:hypothetical protein
MAITYEYPIDFDLRVGEASLEFFPEKPMGGRSSAIKQTGFTQDKRCDTNGRNAARFSIAALQELQDVCGRPLSIRRRSDEHRIERNVVRSLGLRRHAEGVDYQAAACGNNVRLVIRFAQHHVRDFEHPQRGKTEVREARW